tara:strand:+ start:283 stop:1296 length:1014 start_codon:yes stop_codon:yes gene_type:complete
MKYILIILLSLKTYKKIVNKYIMKIKFFENTFDDYIKKKINLHPKLGTILKKVNNQNIIFYGPKGTGKYTQALNYIKKYSETSLKYERKLNITNNKKEYFFKISDVHFEIDMELLGCNAKILWNKIYYQIVDIISSRNNKTGIILCKNFHNIHSELLDIFYSYMQTLYHMNIKLTYIIITEQVSFIPESILNKCLIIPIKRPTKTQYNKCLQRKINKKTSIQKIENIKLFKMNDTNINSIFENVNNVLINEIINYENIQFLSFRDKIYDMFIYQLNISDCIWYILEKLINKKLITEKNTKPILLKVYNFFKLFNNNYRPIYHVESLLFFIIKEIYNF